MPTPREQEREKADRLIDVRQVAQRVGVSVRSIRLYVAGGHFPRPVKIPGCRLAKWRESDVNKWMAELEIKA